MAASNWETTDRRAFLSEMTLGGIEGDDASRWRQRTYDRKVEYTELYPAPEIELVEVEGWGLALETPPTLTEPGYTRRPPLLDAEGVLEGFCQLDGSEPEEILEYARRFGVLWICAEHGMPTSHRIYRKGGRHFTTCPANVASPLPLALWRYWSRRARAVLAIGARVHRGKPGQEDNWRVVCSEPPTDPEAEGEGGGELRYIGIGVGQDLNDDRRALGLELDAWLRRTGSRMGVRWAHGAERPTIGIAARGLFQRLARDIALTVARLDGLAVCDGCGRPYNPERKPRADRRNFCQPCRDDGVPARIRMREKRARERGETDG